MFKFVFSKKKQKNLNFFEATPNMSVKKSEIVRAVLVRSSQGFSRPGFNLIRFYENAAVLINSDNSPRGTLCFFKLYIFFLFFLIINF